MRRAEINRETSETRIKLSLEIDGKGNSRTETGCGFLDHMLTLFARHGGFDLNIKCDGDTNVDYHHTVEDCGIALGNAFGNALGDKRGVNRFGQQITPMDEALALTAVDVSGRGLLVFRAQMPTEKVGDFDTELVREFFSAFARCAGMTIHVRLLDGENTHHVIEAIFKSAARAVGQACAVNANDPERIPSTKGVL